jgi:hypothetical protein
VNGPWTAVTSRTRSDTDLDDDTARDVAARWAHGGGFDLGMTSTSRDEPWLRVSGLVTADEAADPAQIVQSASGNLRAELQTVGASVATWEAIEVWSAAEVERRTRRRARRR